MNKNKKRLHILVGISLIGLITVIVLVWTKGKPTDAIDKVKAKVGELVEGKIYTVRVTGPDGEALEGAKVYRRYSFFDDRSPRSNFESDERGIIKLSEGEIFSRSYYRQSGLMLYAVYDDKLAGFMELDYDMAGEVLELGLKPGCKVSGKLQSTSLENLGQKFEWSNLYVYVGKHRPMSYSSKEHVFEFLLPPGEYKLYGYGEGVYSNTREIEIKSGQEELEVVFDLAANRLSELKGKAAPEFTKIKGWINSGELKLSMLKGKVVLLDFWGYWCGPCIQSMPELMVLHEEYYDDGLVIIGIHDDSIDSVKELKSKLKDLSKDRWEGKAIPFAIALDGGGNVDIEGTEDKSAQGATTAAYGIQSWPTMVLIGKDGKVIKKFHPSVHDRIYELQDLLGLEKDEQVAKKVSGLHS